LKAAIPTAASEFYSGCQNNVPIGGRYFVTTTYAAAFFAEYFYDMRYKAVGLTGAADGSNGS
jgi:hypothetical protein